MKFHMPRPCKQGTEVLVQCGHPWADAPYQVGDPVNLIDPQPLPQHQQQQQLGGTEAPGGPPRVRVDQAGGFLVLYPDILLSGEGEGGGGRHARVLCFAKQVFNGDPGMCLCSQP
jgi:hypothetical protein